MDNMDEEKIKILLVDDEPDFINVMQFWLKTKGYSVISAPDGEKAIAMIKESKPDIVLLDVRMPVMDGTETLKKIREFNKDLPVIIISAYVDDQKKMAELRKSGISGVFYKGTEFAEGISLLEAALRTHKKLKK